jgi:hypothetical protein
MTSMTIPIWRSTSRNVRLLQPKLTLQNMCNSAHLRAHTGGVLCRRLRAVAPPNVRVARIRFPSDDVPVVHRGYGSGERKHQTALA